MGVAERKKKINVNCVFVKCIQGLNPPLQPNQATIYKISKVMSYNSIIFKIEYITQKSPFVY